MTTGVGAALTTTATGVATDDQSNHSALVVVTSPDTIDAAIRLELSLGTGHGLMVAAGSRVDGDDKSAQRPGFFFGGLSAFKRFLASTTSGLLGCLATSSS